MHRIEVNVKTKEVKTIPLTDEEIAQAELNSEVNANMIAAAEEERAIQKLMRQQAKEVYDKMTPEEKLKLKEKN